MPGKIEPITAACAQSPNHTVINIRKWVSSNKGKQRGRCHCIGNSLNSIH